MSVLVINHGAIYYVYMPISSHYNSFVSNMITYEVIKFGGPFELKDGRTSSFYINMRDMLSEPELFNKAVHALGNIAVASFFQEDQLACLPHDRFLMGIPEAASEYAGAVGYHFSVPLLKRRVKQKTYGEPRAIEGRYHAGDDVVLIDDVISSSNSKIDEIKLLELHGLKTAGVAVLVDRQQGGRSELADQGIDFVAAFTINAIAAQALNNKVIDGVTYEKILSELDPREVSI